MNLPRELAENLEREAYDRGFDSVPQMLQNDYVERNSEDIEEEIEELTPEEEEVKERAWRDDLANLIAENEEDRIGLYDLLDRFYEWLDRTSQFRWLRQQPSLVT